MKDMSLRLQGTHKQVFCKKPKKRRSCKNKMAMMQNLYGRFDLASSAKYRAEEVQSRLSTKYPSFMKPMIRSNVTAGFWLSLPRFFCQLHLPRHDTTVTLVDESQEEYKTKYLAERNGLSGGWRGFSLAHNLVEGDVLGFQLFRFCKLKVYIVRANYLAEVDAALVLLHLDAHQKQANPEQCTKCRIIEVRNKVESSVKDFPHNEKRMIILQKKTCYTNIVIQGICSRILTCLQKLQDLPTKILALWML
ncbi:B3 domain-containing protein At5g42700-like isoform X3 [Nicotiana sylvestris]|uniref:B3 domain-containing protein At5g42700-like isoform X4 n=1 Tax=Nicotiana sylvestris TaxID=4096 RepID=A0A1U7WNU3_NICSY|nr:PREDICTED: B3 domain-containing protein At5g42700-like isoform X4 [Nicotiana sylvestris]